MKLMRVVAARFRGSREALAALDLLRRNLDIGERDAAVAPLGHPGQGESDDSILAGRFRDEKIAVVAEIVRQTGGEIVADVDETRTRPRASRRPFGPRGTTTAQCHMSARAS
jgi:hypothetical protein